LRDAALRRSRESAYGIYCLEGRFAIERALTSKRPLRSILVNPTKHRAMADVLAEVSVPVLCATGEVLEAVTGFDVHRGALAIGERWPLPALSDVMSNARLVVALEDLVDTENVGAIFRSAAALGADAMILSPGCADPLWRRSIRVSQATVLTLPWTVAAAWPDDVASLRTGGADVVALDPGEGSELLSSMGAVAQRVLILGSEGHGISDAMRRSTIRRVRIPIRHEVDSLNVAAAAAIAIHHCATTM
jgi:tRNA G18 (ribose-2'-O)-methylase SpoU